MRFGDFFYKMPSQYCNTSRHPFVACFFSPIQRLNPKLPTHSLVLFAHSLLLLVNSQLNISIWLFFVATWDVSMQLRCNQYCTPARMRYTTQESMRKLSIGQSNCRNFADFSAHYNLNEYCWLWDGTPDSLVFNKRSLRYSPRCAVSRELCTLSRQWTNQRTIEWMNECTHHGECPT